MTALKVMSAPSKHTPSCTVDGIFRRSTTTLPGPFVSDASSCPDHARHLPMTVQIAALKRTKKGSPLILLDKNGSTAKVVAKELAKKGFGKVSPSSLSSSSSSSSSSSLSLSSSSSPSSSSSSSSSPLSPPPPSAPHHRHHYGLHAQTTFLVCLLSHFLFVPKPPDES